MLTCVIDARAAKRLREGHPWVYSNQVISRPEGAAAGDVVGVRTAGSPGDDLGTAFWNPQSLVSLRHLGFEGRRPDRELLASRLRSARDLRTKLYPDSDAHRLCHGEADLLPGLFIDAYGPVAVVQAFSAGMDRLLGDVAAVLHEEMGFAHVVERNTARARGLEGLVERSGTLVGDPPPRVEVRLPPQRLLVDVLAGQKTGAFLDQRDNRQAAARFAPGARCYDAYSNIGGFSIAAALAGAASVVAVDSSSAAIAGARDNAALNGVGDRVETLVADALVDMDHRHRRRERFDLVMVDPPSFTSSRKHVPQARRALAQLNRRAMTLAEPGGILVTSDCSHHVLEATFHDLLQEAAVQAGRRLRILEVRGQAPDHPWLAAMPESRYLKCVIAQVA